MCEYCEKRKQIPLHRRESDSNITDCYIVSADDGAAIFMRESAVLKFGGNGKPYIQQDNDLMYMDINYCPFCGRNLNEP